MISIQQARLGIGDAVVYRTYAGAVPEQGVITSVNDSYVFVRYGADLTSQATSPESLSFVHTRGDA